MQRVKAVRKFCPQNEALYVSLVNQIKLGRDPARHKAETLAHFLDLCGVTLTG